MDAIQTRIAVIGCNPVSLFSALYLARRGFEVSILADRLPEDCDFKSNELNSPFLGYCFGENEAHQSLFQTSSVKYEELFNSDDTMDWFSQITIRIENAAKPDESHVQSYSGCPQRAYLWLRKLLEQKQGKLERGFVLDQPMLDSILAGGSVDSYDFTILSIDSLCEPFLSNLSCYSSVEFFGKFNFKRRPGMSCVNVDEGFVISARKDGLVIGGFMLENMYAQSEEHVRNMFEQGFQCVKKTENIDYNVEDALDVYQYVTYYPKKSGPVRVNKNSLILNPIGKNSWQCAPQVGFSAAALVERNFKK